ncbi:MAG: hypothetical protein DSY43_00495 [Gammaproteobacteria bacterium]|nr:MAG: hypothetical protein DSY43_00495 [Gammaproteobacteria bacterium]
MPRVVSANASKSTIRRRSREISNHRFQVSGATEESSLAQQRDEVKKMSLQERQELMNGIKQKIFVSAEVAVAMQSDVDLPWNKIRLLNRYMYL